MIVYIEQNTQEGFGHAVHCAKNWAGNEPFLLMLGDHVYISGNKKSCAKQLIDGYHVHNKSIIGLERTHRDQIHLFGTAAGNRISDDPPAYRLTQVAEKPDLSYAENVLTVAGLPADFFLCFFGMYLFTPAIYGILDEHIQQDIRDKGEIQLTSAISELINKEGALGLEINGQRLDMGTPLGYLKTQQALARSGVFTKETS